MLPLHTALLLPRHCRLSAAMQEKLGRRENGAECQAAMEGRTYLVELVKAECDARHDDSQGTVISPSGAHRAYSWERRRVRRRGTCVLPRGRGELSAQCPHLKGPATPLRETV